MRILKLVGLVFLFFMLFLPVASGQINAWIVFLILGCCVFAYAFWKKKRDAKRAEELQKRIDEAMSCTLEPVQTLRAMVKAPEVSYCTAMVNLLESRVVRYEGANSGVSVRVAKGVSIRAGSMRSVPVREMVEVAQGELVLTDQRILFAGDRKSFSVPLRKVITIKPYLDGMSFSDGKRTYSVQARDGADMLRFMVLSQRVWQASD